MPGGSRAQKRRLIRLPERCLEDPRRKTVEKRAFLDLGKRLKDATSKGADGLPDCLLMRLGNSPLQLEQFAW